jgi:hypothetical protein
MVIFQGRVAWKIKVLSEAMGGTGKSGETEKGNSGALKGLSSSQTLLVHTDPLFVTAISFLSSD